MPVTPAARVFEANPPRSAWRSRRPVAAGAFGALVAAALLVGGTLPARAQAVRFRAGVGPVLAPSFGGTAMLAVELKPRGPVFLRGEGRYVGEGRDDDYDRSARVVALGGGAGLTHAVGHGRAAVHGLVAAGAAIDPREGDRATTLGVALGVSRPGSLPFAEVRYERWLQNGAVHYRLDYGVLTLIVGLAIP